MYLSSWVLTGFIFLIILAKIGYFVSIGRSIYLEDKVEKLNSNL